MRGLDVPMIARYPLGSVFLELNGLEVYGAEVTVGRATSNASCAVRLRPTVPWPSLIR